MPLVLAHRGANKRAPQNTLPAFSEAVRLKADGIETDVHLSLDNELVICHNYTVDATSNGSGEIASMTYEQLSRLDFGAYFGAEFAGVRLPKLSEALEVVKDMTLINIELKAPKTKNDLVKRTIEEVYKHNLQNKVIISCFNPDCIFETKEIDSTVKTGLLYENDDLGREIMNFSVAKYCKQLKADAAHPLRLLIDRQTVEECHGLNIAVNPWTVNEYDDIKRLAEYGCDALISDVPDYCLKILEELKYERA